MIKEKQFRLILREPGRGDKVLVEGSEGFVSKKRTELSFEYNSDFLVIEEIKEEEEEDKPGLLGVIVSLVLSVIILRIYGKRK